MEEELLQHVLVSKTTAKPAPFLTPFSLCTGLRWDVTALGLGCICPSRWFSSTGNCGNSPSTLLPAAWLQCSNNAHLVLAEIAESRMAKWLGSHSGAKGASQRYDLVWAWVLPLALTPTVSSTSLPSDGKFGLQNIGQGCAFLWVCTELCTVVLWFQWKPLGVAVI